MKQQAPGELPQPWTASRCHRLLRPLLSRIALLRKDVSSVSAQPSNASAGQDGYQGKRRAEEDAWLMPRKKLRHTYSRKYADRPTSEPLIPEGVKFRAAKCFQPAGQDNSTTRGLTAVTPLLHRARGQEVTSPAQELQAAYEQKLARCKRSSKGAGFVDVDERLAPLRSKVSPTRYADYEAIFRTLEALLRATKHDNEEKKGTSSLLDTCLRKVPQYISGVQAWEVYEAEKNGTRSAFESSDTAFRIYTDLEALGSSNYGWKQLRTVARADALSVIREAMAEGLFSDEFSVLLIDLCVEYGAANETNGLIEEFVVRQYPEPSCTESTFTENTLLRPLSFLRNFYFMTGRSSFLLRIYSNLLFSRMLPLNWLVTHEFQHVWALSYRIVSRGVATLEAVNFLVTAITLMCRRQRSSRSSEQQALAQDMAQESQQTLSTALAMLSAMKIIGDNEFQAGGSSHAELERVARIGRNLAYTLDACLVETKPWKWRQRRLGGDLLCLAKFLTSPTATSEHVITHLSKSIEWTCDSHSRKRWTDDALNRHHYDALVSIISSIAKNCGRGTTSQASRNHLARLCKLLGHLGLQDDTIQSVNKTGAFFLAQQTNDLRDLIYAERLASSTSGFPRSTQPGTHMEMLFVGYRWEETIGEWITASPVVEKSTTRGRFLRSSSTSDVKSRIATEWARSTEKPPTPLVTGVSAGHGRRKSAHVRIFEKSGNSPVIEPTRNDCETRDMQLRGTIDNSICNHVSSITSGSRDELDEDKENIWPKGQGGPPQRSNSRKSQLPTAKRRRMRLSGGDPHSDDELGI